MSGDQPSQLHLRPSCGRAAPTRAPGERCHGHRQHNAYQPSHRDLGYLLSGVGVPRAQGSGTVTSPCSCSKRCHVSNAMQNLPPTPKPGPQLFQNHTSLLPASIWSATTSWPPRTAAPLATATSPDASGVSKLEYQPIPVMIGRRTSARSACSTPNACLYDVIQPSCLAALQTSSPLPPGSFGGYGLPSSCVSSSYR